MSATGSTSRVRPDAGAADLRKLPKGPNGRALCRQCSTEVPVGRRTFCGEPCIHTWKVQSDPGYARRHVWKRDQGKCALCPTVVPQGGAWDMDHIVPVVEGGGCCGLDNLRTLCRPCHKRVTAELAKRRAEARRAAKGAA